MEQSFIGLWDAGSRLTKERESRSLAFSMAKVEEEKKKEVEQNIGDGQTLGLFCSCWSYIITEYQFV